MRVKIYCELFQITEHRQIQLMFSIVSVVGGLVLLLDHLSAGGLLFTLRIVSTRQYGVMFPTEMLQAAIRMFLTKTHTNSASESTEKLYDNNIGENQKNEDEIRPISRSWEFVYQRNDHSYECVRKNNSLGKKSNAYRRKRVKSCPEYMDLRKLSKSLELAIIQLKEICEEGISIYDK